MQIWYLTPASLGYLTQFILGLIISGYLIYRVWGHDDANVQTTRLAAFFIFVTLYIGLTFLDVVLVPSVRLIAVYLQNVMVAGAVSFLLRFAYGFPEENPHLKLEMRIVFLISLAYFFFELIFAAYRFSFLFQNEVIYRYRWLDYLPAVLLLWVPLVLLRQTLFASKQAAPGINGWQAFWKPQGGPARTTRALMLVYILPFLISLGNALTNRSLISRGSYQAAVSISILFALFFVVSIYINYLPENTSFRVKLVGAILMVSLAALGTVGWVTAPIYATTYSPSLAEKTSFRFTPNTQGGYDISAEPFRFDADPGTRLPITDSNNPPGNLTIDFPFPFYEQAYPTIYVMDNGAVGMGRAVDYHNIQSHYGKVPAIFPLYLDLVPDNGGVYARRLADQLILTWDVHNFYDPKAKYKFQMHLFSNGAFEIAYDTLPLKIAFQPDDSPDASVWMIGAVRGTPTLTPQTVDIFTTSSTVPSGSQGFVMDYYLDFRRYLHHLLLPLLFLILGNSLVVLLGVPFLIQFNLVRPLKSLLSGAQKVALGDLTVEMPVEYRDEIGSLAASLNTMVAQMRAQVTGLEERVAARTQELQLANDRLRAEIDDHESAEMQIIQQQRELAAAEEREQMARDLHDSFGQVMGYINVQVQATQALLEKTQIQAALSNLQLLVQVAQGTHSDLRQYILGLRDSVVPQRSFYQTLSNYLSAFSQAWGIETVFSPPQNTLPILPDTVQDQVLHIIQEALVNIRKHAQARRVELLITSMSDEVAFIVSDDGRGFDMKSAPGVADKHFGLSIMRERAEQVGGRLEIRSAVGQGTRVLTYIPRILPSATRKDELSEVRGLRILLVDDQPLFLAGMQNLLTARGLTVIGQARDGLDALDQVRALRPDVVVMDVQMPNCDGIEATRLIKAEFPETKVVLLTVSEDEEHILDAIKYGAAGYLLKSLDANDIFNMLAGVVRGEIQIAPGLATRLLGEFNQAGTTLRVGDDRDDFAPAELTMRQWDVLRLVSRGMTYKEAGKTLNLTERAIKYHMAQILERLQLKNREQVITYVRQYREARKKKGL